MLRGEIEESEKVGSRWELNPGHLACAATTTGQPPALTILYGYVLCRWY